MLDASTIRLFSGFLVAAVFGTIALSLRRRSRGSRPLDFRAEDSPPSALQILWGLSFLVPTFIYPLAVVLAPSLTYGTALNFAFPFDAPFQLLGLALSAVGGGLILWSERTLGRFMVIRIGVARDHELITAGPYARVRHPTYAGVQLAVIGLTLAFLSDVLLAFAILAVILANYRAQKEEGLLASPVGFGERYRQYMARTGRFLPRLLSRP